MSNLIMKISQYQYYFAPILETCMADILNIPVSEIIKCPIIMENIEIINNDGSSVERNYMNVTTHFTSNTMKYVGNVSVDKYLSNTITNDEILGVIKTFETYTHLLKGVINMQNMTSSIIHMDLKADNIIMDESHDIPIIIDFGFAVTNTDLLNMVDYAESLNYYYWSYQYDADETFTINWPMEVDLLCYISQIELKLNKNEITDVIHKKDIFNLQNVVDDYINKTSIREVYSLSDESISYFSSHTKYYLSTFEFMNWKVLIDDLLRTYYSWDNYALALVYIYIINHVGIEFDNYYSNSFIQHCKNDLVNMIISPPGKRLRPEDTLQSLFDHWKTYFMDGNAVQ